MTFATYTQQVVVEGHENLRHFNAAEDVLQGQVVKLDVAAGRGVEPSDASGEDAIGVAIEDASSGEQVTVATAGAIVRASPDDAINAGDLLTTDAGTNEGEVTTATSGDPVIGIALEDSTGTNVEAGVTMLVAYSLEGQ